MVRIQVKPTSEKFTYCRYFQRAMIALKLTSRQRIARKLPLFGLNQERPSSSLTQPPTAPKPVINIRHIRENPEIYSENCANRNYVAQQDNPQKILQSFSAWKQLQKDARSLRERHNQINAKLKSLGGPDDVELTETPNERQDLIEEAKGLTKLIKQSVSQEISLQREIDDLAASLPNFTSSETPIGEVPGILGYINAPPDPSSLHQDYAKRSHVDIGKNYDLLDLESAATTSGWGWYHLKNEGALLEQALVQYALSVAMKHGFSAISPPSMVYSHIAAACGFQPRDVGGEQQTYVIARKEEDRKVDQKSRHSSRVKPELCLAATAEIPFAGMMANTTMKERELPTRIVGPSRCYRAEAGARGANTKGLYRVHEFTKVEMFAWTKRDQENDAFQSMLEVQKEILFNLGMHCRILEMPSNDLGASAVRKIDIEAFFPSRLRKWGEVTSVSICTDYQTRRLNTWVKLPDGSSDFPSTVNGTALAVPRVLAALLEIGWSEKDSCIKIPQVLLPWMHGIQSIKKRR